ncbi:serine protease [Bradyrhizobium sp. RT3b]|uniref:serine protease n=1 Tax=Bradyrhizobium sp. RT3b TaxID=3156334 RepID=UPI003395D97C
MKLDISRAVARVLAKHRNGTEVAGTAFLVTERHLLTAFHVIGDRIASQEAPTFYNGLTISFAEPTLQNLEGSIVEGCFDPISDWALIELSAPVSGVRPLPLGTISNGEIEECRRLGKPLAFESWGYPAIARMTGSGLTIEGRIQDQHARYQEAWAYQLYSENAAAAVGDPLNGLSGAPCLVDGAAVGIIRSNLVAPNRSGSFAEVHIAGGILYACPIAAPTIQEYCAKYLPILDPVRGLPGLPHNPLPLEPFRYLRWYGAKHAEVFFGRNQRLRDLYFQVTRAGSPSVILVYGASGVGKSSLLEAGLLPRLLQTHEVRAQRREANKTLLQSFNEQLLLAEAAVRVTKMPIVLLLDQVDEVFLDEKTSGTAELASLAKRVAQLASQPGVPPTLLLSFRSEWLANIRFRLLEAEVAISDFYLERLTRAEIENVIDGIASTDRLRSFYGIAVDNTLPRRVAEDLLSDPRSAVTPLLSIILTRLWSDAKSRRGGEQRLSRDAYDRSMRTRLDLDRFLSEQIETVATKRTEDVSSGLVFDILYRHTTDFGTSKELSWTELCSIYYQFENDNDYLRSLINVLGEQSLLVTVDQPDESGSSASPPQITRLIHDTLAAPVRHAYQKSDRPGQRAERQLMSRMEDWSAATPQKSILDSSAIASIAQGSRGMRAFTREETVFIQSSVAAGRLAFRRSLRKVGVAVLTALILGGLTAGYVGTTSVWRVTGETSYSRREGRIAYFRASDGYKLVTSNPDVLSYNPGSTVIWNAASGQALHRYEGQQVNGEYPYLVLKKTKATNYDSLEALFSIVNVESGDLKELEPRGDDDPAWADSGFFLSSAKAGDFMHLTVSDLKTAETIRMIQSVDSATEVSVIDPDRLLMRKNDELPPDIWSISRDRVIGQLRAPTDKWVRTLAVSVDSAAKRIAIVQEISQDQSRNDNDYEASIDPPGVIGGTYVVRIWDVSKENAHLVAESAIAVGDVLNQLIEPFPEGEFQFRATVSLHDATVVLTLRVKEAADDVAIVLLDANLSFLDSSTKFLQGGSISSLKRSFLYLGAPDQSLILRDVSTGQRLSLARFFGENLTLSKLALDQEARQLLALRDNSLIELWELDKDSGQRIATMTDANVLNARFTIENSAIAAWREGGLVNLWSLEGRSIGVISGIAGNKAPSVYWNSEKCKATLWTTGGRLLQYTYEWEVLGLFHFSKNGCLPGIAYQPALWMGTDLTPALSLTGN